MLLWLLKLIVAFIAREEKYTYQLMEDDIISDKEKIPFIDNLLQIFTGPDLPNV